MRMLILPRSSCSLLLLHRLAPLQGNNGILLAMAAGIARQGVCVQLGRCSCFSSCVVSSCALTCFDSLASLSRYTANASLHGELKLGGLQLSWHLLNPCKHQQTITTQPTKYIQAYMGNIENFYINYVQQRMAMVNTSRLQKLTGKSWSHSCVGGGACRGKGIDKNQGSLG